MSDGRDGAPDPLVGATVAGRYRIISLIARGGMGKVYRAEQLGLGRICALKVLARRDLGDKDPDFFKRFSREAEAVAKLTHPSTVTVFDYGKDENLEAYFIAMEYLDGRTLHRVLAEEGALEELRVNKIAQQICRSLAEAHGIGLVHRDLKPGNVLLVQRGDERELVKVLDFGLVKDTSLKGDDLTQTGLFIGSPKYTSPEQVMGGEISLRSDIYSLGAVMYELLVGRPPFDKKVSTATLMAQVSEMPPPLAEVNPGISVSPAMEAIVFRCLEKDPEKRFGSMREVLIALKLAAGEHVDPADPRPSLSSFPDASRSSRPSLTPFPTGAGTGSGPRPAVQLTSPVDSLSPPTPPTLGGAAAPRKRSSLSPYLIAIVAAAAGGAGMLAFSRARPAPASPHTIESVFVPIAVPATAMSVTESNPLAGIRLVRIETTPPGARVSDRGTEVCLATPCQIVLRGKGVEAEYQLQLTRNGYKTAMLVVGPKDEEVSATLDPAAADEPVTAASTSPSAAPSGEDPWASAESPVAAPAGALPSATGAAPDLPARSAEAGPAAQAPTASTITHFQEGMTRPLPVAVPAPVYTREALTSRVEGTVIAKCVITTAGTLTGCRIIKGLPHMDEAVLTALSASRYTPVTYEGRPVSVDYAFTIKLVPP